MTMFYQRLREARKAAGYSQEAFANKMGISRTNYIPCKTGKAYPAIMTVPKIARALGIPRGIVFEWIVADLEAKSN